MYPSFQNHLNVETLNIRVAEMNIFIYVFCIYAQTDIIIYILHDIEDDVIYQHYKSARKTSKYIDSNILSLSKGIKIENCKEDNKFSFILVPDNNYC